MNPVRLATGALRASTGWSDAPLPALVLLTVFAVAPVGLAAVLSFTNWTGVGPIHWVGLANWTRCSPVPPLRRHSSAR